MRGPRVAVDDEARRVHHAACRMHEPVADRRDALGVTGSAGAAGVVHVAGKRDEAGMRCRLVERLAVAAVADDAIFCSEGVCRIEASAACFVAVGAGILRHFRDVCFVARARRQDE